MTGSTPGVAAFDFDGTLVEGDSLPRFLGQVLGSGAFGLLLAASGPSMLAAYRRAGRDGAKAALLARAVAGLDAGVLASHGESFSAALERRLRPEMVRKLSWHGDRGHRLILVSASLAVYLEPLGRRLGFDQVIATDLEVNPDGILTGRIAGVNVRARQKAIRLTEVLGPGPVELWAYGNSRGDREMLAMADHPVIVGRRIGRRPR